ncbi:MAG: ParB/RepB/Spo0J family partition protein [Defluviitaleaceae bacterium]|nr:ParB/RepB/Spo0J family partition protein [Defluviitaleaceae bacterium]
MKKGLGKGLGALITNYEEALETNNQEILEIELEKIVPNKDQPRKKFKEPEIAELAESIAEFGVIQPLIVKKSGDSDTYTIVAGERRWRAAQVAGLAVLPVIVRDYSDFEILGIALIENIQREDLNPVEEAVCYKRLNEEFGMTQEDIAKKIGKSRSHITNCIRILKLDDRVLEMVTNEKLSMGHAKAILSVNDRDGQFYLATEILEEGMNVRQSEDFVRKYIASAAQIEEELAGKKTAPKADTEIYTNYQKRLQEHLGTRCNIKTAKNGGGGRIEINYFSREDLDRIISIIKK